MAQRVLLAAVLLAGVTCAYTWPLPAYATSAIAHDRGDPLLVTWILWWTSHTIPLTSAWWNAPAFYPSAGVLAFSENLLSLAPIAAPIVHATGSPILAYNVAFLSSYVLSGLGAYFLAFVLTRCHTASFAAAIAFAFAPYRLSHTQHLQLLSSYWMPVAVAALHLFAASPRWRWAGLFAAAWALQALASGYYLFFLTTFVVLWLIWFVPRRVPPRQVVRLLIAWVIAAVLLLPIFYGYYAVHAAYGFKRSPVEMVNYSADVAGVLSASPDSWLWSRLHAAVSSESEQFPGLFLILLLLGGAVATWLAPRETRVESPNDRRRDRPALFYAAAAVAMWLLSLGPVLQIGGTVTSVPGPYAVLAVLPGFDGMRVPARLWMVSVLCLAVCAAFVIARIQTPRTRRLVAGAAIAGFLLDAWPRDFPVVAAPGVRVTTGRASARLGLPLHETETETMFGAIPQKRPVFNGYSGYAAPQHAALRELLEHHDREILNRLAAAEPIEVIVETIGDPDGAWNAYVRNQPGVTPVDAADGWTSYLVPATGAVAPPPYRGEPIAVASVTASTNLRDIGAILDADRVSRWHASRQQGGETITVDLGMPQRVGAIEMWLGAYPGQFPRRLSIDVSADGASWTTVYTGGTALHTYDAAVRAPREVPLTFMIHRDAVRLLRLRQTAADSHGWSIVELRVLR